MKAAKTSIQRFWIGARFIATGWRFLKQNKKIWPWIVIPWVVNTALIISGWSIGLPWLQQTIFGLIAKLGLSGFWFDLIYYPLLVLIGIGFVVVWLVMIMAISTAIVAPFLSIISESTLKICSDSKVAQQRSVVASVTHFFKMLWAALLKSIFFALVGLVLFVLSFVPVVNVIAAYASMCLFAADVFDYSLEAQGHGLASRLLQFRNRWPEIAGLGLVLTLTSILPGLTVLLLPVAVIGAALYMAEPKDART